MGRHVILREIVVHDLAEPVIDHGLLVQRHANSHHDAPQYLASRRLWIEDATGCGCANNPGNPHNAEFFVYADFGKDGRVRIADISLCLLGVCAGLSVLDNFGKIRRMHHLRNRKAATGVVFAADPAGLDFDVLETRICQRRVGHALGPLEQSMLHRFARGLHCRSVGGRSPGATLYRGGRERTSSG